MYFFIPFFIVAKNAKTVIFLTIINTIGLNIHFKVEIDTQQKMAFKTNSLAI